MRPTTVISVVAGVLFGVAGLLLTVWALVDTGDGKPWHYWIAPALVLGFGAILLALVAGYFAKVGRLELRGRPRDD